MAARDSIDTGNVRMQKSIAMGHTPSGLGGGKPSTPEKYAKGGRVQNLKGGRAGGGQIKTTSGGRRGSARTC